MMNIKSNQIIRYSEFPVREELTISSMLYNNIDSLILFRNASNTEISAEYYNYLKFYLVLKGEVLITRAGIKTILKEFDIIGINKNTLYKIDNIKDSIYFEFNLEGEGNMNKKIIENKFNVKDLLDYEEGSIVNLNLSTTDKTSISLMAFDKGQGLTEHKAPGEALLTIVDGTCILGYEGVEYTLHAGDSFGFKKGGRHYLKAIEQFKMVLILEKE